MKRVIAFSLFTLYLIWAGAACTAESEDRQATVDALGRLVVETATASAGDEITPQDRLATAEAGATEVAQTIVAESATVEAAATAAAATAAALPSPTTLPSLPPSELLTPSPPPDPQLAAIEAELSQYGIDPAEGELAWIHSPVTLELEGLQQYAATSDFPDTIAGDFVLSADLTWNTESSEAGCGFGLRATALEPGTSQYLLLAVPREGGRVLFQTRLDGVMVATELFDLAVNPADPLFNAQNGGTNKLAVVARGNTFAVFSNGALLGEISPPTELADGLVAFAALSDSGRTQCVFDDGWLWLSG